MQELIIDLMFHLEREIGTRLNTERFVPFLEKEKEQIMDAFKIGVTEGLGMESNSLGYDANEEQYYNQIYNQNK